MSEADVLALLADVNLALWSVAPPAHVHRCAGVAHVGAHLHGCSVRICADQLERLCFPCKRRGAR